MPLEDRDQFIQWSEFIIEGSNAGMETASPEVVEAAGAVFMYINEYLEKKRANPGDDILSKVLQLEGEDKWSDEEIFGMMFLFVLAGLDTVTAGIGFALYHLAKNQELQARLRDDYSLIPAFLEELLRLESPAPIAPRVTTSEVELAGVTIPEVPWSAFAPAQRVVMLVAFPTQTASALRLQTELPTGHSEAASIAALDPTWRNENFAWSWRKYSIMCQPSSSQKAKSRRSCGLQGRFI